MLFNPYHKLTLLLFGFFIFFSVPSIVQKNRTNARSYSIIKLNTLSVMDPRTPTWQSGFERRFNKHWATEVAIGLPLYLVYKNKNHDSLYNHFNKIKTQLKYYFKESDNYLAAEIFRTSVSYNAYHHGYITDSESYGFRSADFKKHIYGFAIKFGSLIPLAGKWRLEPAAGYGIRFVHTTVKATDVNPGWERVNGWGMPEKVGLKTTPHMAIEAKIAYIL